MYWKVRSQSSAQTKRVMSLRDPRLKMSKSHEDPRSRIHINDDAGLIRDKIRSAVTDSVSGVSFDPGTRPGVSNLLAIVSHFDDQDRSANDLAQIYKDSDVRELKVEAANVIAHGLASTREKYESLVHADSSRYLDRIAHEGSLKARNLAEKTMSTVRKAVGIW